MRNSKFFLLFSVFVSAAVLLAEITLRPSLGPFLPWPLLLWAVFLSGRLSPENFFKVFLPTILLGEALAGLPSGRFVLFWSATAFALVFAGRLRRGKMRFFLMAAAAAAAAVLWSYLVDNRPGPAAAAATALLSLPLIAKFANR